MNDDEGIIEVVRHMLQMQKNRQLIRLILMHPPPKKSSW